MREDRDRAHVQAHGVGPGLLGLALHLLLQCCQLLLLLPHLLAATGVKSHCLHPLSLPASGRKLTRWNPHELA